MQPEITRATPAGCLVGLFGLLAYLYAGLCAFGVWQALPLQTQTPDWPSVRSLLVQGSVAVVVGTVLLRVGWKMALKADMSNPNDPGKPVIRF